MALALCMGIAAFSAFDKPESTEFSPVVAYDETGAKDISYAGTSGAVLKSWAKDTITNAANDTLTFPGVLASPYQYCYQVRLTNISGTRSIKFYLEQVSASTSTRWMKVDSMVTSGSTINDYLMKGANTWGIKNRVIVDGAGTQSTAYQLDAIMKKTN